MSKVSKLGRPPLSPSDLVKTLCLYHDHGATKAAAELGISRNAIYKRLKLAGAVTARPHQPVWTPADIRHYPEA
ncbi:helix-turn-helix domain-containing protein [Azospirillum sp. A26]|uniref:helix-turn-helix domain-containing protein n=1 Tax=Azospirillum sp. A26 TaxID=3160607 RepID=UPI003671111D